MVQAANQHRKSSQRLCNCLHRSFHHSVFAMDVLNHLKGNLMNRIIITLTFIALALAFTPSAEAFHHGKGKRGLKAAGKVAKAPVRLLKKLCH